MKVPPLCVTDRSPLKTCLGITGKTLFRRLLFIDSQRGTDVESFLESLFFKNQLVIFLPRKQTQSGEITVCPSLSDI